MYLLNIQHFGFFIYILAADCRVAHVASNSVASRRIEETVREIAPYLSSLSQQLSDLTCAVTRKQDYGEDNNAKIVNNVAATIPLHQRIHALGSHGKWSHTSAGKNCKC